VWNRLAIVNPKRRTSTSVGRDEWFPYYAGFSGEFARKVLGTAGTSEGSVCLDPWNGSGTTTAAAAVYKYRALGFDLNPVMVVVAKARLLPRVEVPSVPSLLATVVRTAVEHPTACDSDDPLLSWFFNRSAATIRSLERSVHTLLISVDSRSKATDAASGMSAIGSFFYVALFRTVRHLLRRFISSNPTWVRRPVVPQARLRPTSDEILLLFQRYTSDMADSVLTEPSEWDFVDGDCIVKAAASDKLPIADSSVDIVVTSPPYCTRIDYAIATSPELAVLGLNFGKKLKDLRKQLIGSPTIQKQPTNASPSWGATCNSFLEEVRSHRSKAALSYYYKTYAQYFCGIHDSMREIARCMKPEAKCIIVVQDSFFKDVKADLPTIFTEIAGVCGLTLGRREDFDLSTTLININTRSREYRTDSSSVESVLCFNKA
jgi:hypothetical protein